MGGLSNGPVQTPYPLTPIGARNKRSRFKFQLTVRMRQKCQWSTDEDTLAGCTAMQWTFVKLSAKPTNDRTQVEHNMRSRRATWSPLWWWPCCVLIQKILVQMGLRIRLMVNLHLHENCWSLSGFNMYRKLGLEGPIMQHIHMYAYRTIYNRTVWKPLCWVSLKGSTQISKFWFQSCAWLIWQIRVHWSTLNSALSRSHSTTNATSDASRTSTVWPLANVWWPIGPPPDAHRKQTVSVHKQHFHKIIHLNFVFWNVSVSVSNTWIKNSQGCHVLCSATRKTCKARIYT